MYACIYTLVCVRASVCVFEARTDHSVERFSGMYLCMCVPVYVCLCVVIKIRNTCVCIRQVVCVRMSKCTDMHMNARCMCVHKDKGCARGLGWTYYVWGVAFPHVCAYACHMHVDM